jgi:hypothetical protein
MELIIRLADKVKISGNTQETDLSQISEKVDTKYTPQMAPFI